MSIHFISDLHLDREKPEISEIFIRYLTGPARQAETLYILGDLFEYWIGDDGSIPEYEPEISALENTSDAGVDICFMHGNRDFLVGAEFERQTGARIITEPTVIDLGGRQTLLLHGDSLCTDDIKHQKFRSIVLNPDTQKELLTKPLEQRLQMAKMLRAMSQAGNKASDIMDVNQQAVESEMKKYGVTQLVHGHTHRPDVHEFTVEGQPMRRIVLPDWSTQEGGVVIFEDGEFNRETLA